MSLIVEDGTGLSTAESYESVINADSYAAAYGRTEWFPLATQAREIRLRLATQFVDTMFVYSGLPLIVEQALVFPRLSLVVRGQRVIGVPLNVKKATIELATYPGLPNLYPSDQVNELKSFSKEIGGLKKSGAYRDTPTTRHYWVAEALLQPFVFGSTSSGMKSGSLIPS